jgi:predicted acyl esterase
MALTQHCARAQQSYEVFVQNGAMKTRDGVTLKADIYRPQANGKFPVRSAVQTLSLNLVQKLGLLNSYLGASCSRGLTAPSKYC